MVNMSLREITQSFMSYFKQNVLVINRLFWSFYCTDFNLATIFFWYITMIEIFFIHAHDKNIKQTLLSLSP